MWQKIYKKFIAPRQGDEDTRNREYVLNILLLGTLVITVAAFLVLLYSYLSGHTYVGPRTLGVLVMAAVVLAMYALSRSGKFKIAAYALLSLYFAIMLGVSSAWGVTMPVTVALLGLIIVLASILIGARYSLYAAATVTMVVIFMKVAEMNGWIQPDWSWAGAPSDGDTLTGTVFIFAIIAVVSWLFNYRMEWSLHRAERAEAALRRQKALLETTVEKRTRELQTAQLEKVQELYRFAELGQLSTALLHDLANHLTTLTLDIEGLEAQNRSRMLQRAKRSMRYIDSMVMRVRDQLRGKSKSTALDIVTEIEATVKILRHKAAQNHVALQWNANSKTKELRTKGDSIRLRQLLANIISNAIDAYEPAEDDPSRQVGVSAKKQGAVIIVTVEDWGRGISAEDRAKLFEPFYSTKKSGMGLGLFIAKQIAEEQFGGGIRIDRSKKHTVFVITLKARA